MSDPPHLVKERRRPRTRRTSTRSWSGWAVFAASLVVVIGIAYSASAIHRDAAARGDSPIVSIQVDLGSLFITLLVAVTVGLLAWTAGRAESASRLTAAEHRAEAARRDEARFRARAHITAAISMAAAPART